jgi:hypothetical protein
VNPAFAGVPGLGQPPFVPYAGINPYGGLSHTSAEGIDPLSRSIWSDPLMAQRLAQTFPYAYAPYALPQVVSLT